MTRRDKKHQKKRIEKLTTLDTSPIEGWMDIDELEFLHDRASEMQAIVEIGAFQGRSTIALLRGCPNGVVFTVDPWRGIEFAYREFIYNTKTFHNLVIIKMDSVNAAKLINTPVDMVFIDGNHIYDLVKADINSWLPKTKKLICGHDYGEFDSPGVKQAVDELVGDIKLVNSIWYKEL